MADNTIKYEPMYLKQQTEANNPYTNPKFFPSVTPKIQKILNTIPNTKNYFLNCIFLGSKHPILYEYIKEFLLRYPKLKDETLENGRNILHYVSAYSQRTTKKIILLLINSKFDINLKDKYGQTPLHYATMNVQTTSSINTIKMLVKHGANIDEKNYDEITSLFIAARNLNIYVIDTLIDLGANLELRDEYGWSVLHFVAVNYKHLSSPTIMKTLVERGVDVNIVDNRGWTPLHLAVRYFTTSSSVDAITTLINLGANVNIKTNENITLLELALNESENDHIINLLFDKGFDINIIDDFNGENGTKLLKLLLEKKYEPKQEGHCIVCYDDGEKIFTCAYNHGICGECLTYTLKTVCLFCSNKLNFTN